MHRYQGEKITYEIMHGEMIVAHLDNAFVDLALRGKQMTVQNAHLIADDISTNGLFPKAWIRKEGQFYLLKDGSTQAVENELLASRICQCFQCNQVIYEEDYFENQKVTCSKIMTNLEYGIVSREYFEYYAVNREISPREYIQNLDRNAFYQMNILDYLIGNTDRHWGNWGFLIDHETNQPVRLHDLMDFNQSFQSYDTIEGANCQTVLPEIMTQKEAAIEAVRKVGLNQISDIQENWFKDRFAEYDMFCRRLEILKINTGKKEQ